MVGFLFTSNTDVKLDTEGDSSYLLFLAHFLLFAGDWGCWVPGSVADCAVVSPAQEKWSWETPGLVVGALQGRPRSATCVSWGSMLPMSPGSWAVLGQPCHGLCCELWGLADSKWP